MIGNKITKFSCCDSCFDVSINFQNTIASITKRKKVNENSWSNDDFASTISPSHSFADNPSRRSNNQKNHVKGPSQERPHDTSAPKWCLPHLPYHHRGCASILAQFHPTHRVCQEVERPKSARTTRSSSSSPAPALAQVTKSVCQNNVKFWHASPRTWRPPRACLPVRKHVHVLCTARTGTGGG